MILDLSNLSNLRNRHVNAKIVLGSGCFDLLHPGHIEYIEIAKSFGDILVITVLSDKKVKERKGLSRPIMDEAIRVSMVHSIRGVDYALIEPYSPGNTRASLMEVIKRLQPDVFVNNDDNDSWEPFRESMKQHGTELRFMQAAKINSTTNIIKTIRLNTNEKIR
jgi:D-beta-D-heptose 7-phosphate kinase / D-beta-D-heptose 1-phosphate adenosyltransferase